MRFFDKFNVFNNHKKYLIFLFSIAVIHGLIYVFMIPPWQHYDEPGHFEVVKLYSLLNRNPTQDDINEEVRREINQSMREYRFWEYQKISTPPEDFPDTWIGPEQIGDLPLYYFLASLPLRIFKDASITSQLYLGRFVSFLLFITTIYVTWLFGVLLYGKNHVLSFTTPLFLALLPGFVDIMTSVNNDVAAVFSASLFLVNLIQIINKKYNLVTILCLVSSFCLVLISKITAWPILFSLFLFLFLILFSKNIKLGLGALFIVIFIFVGVINFKDIPAYYYSRTSQTTPLRERINQDNFVFHLHINENNPDNKFYYRIDVNKLNDFRGKVMVMGGLVWASENTKFALPHFINNFDEVNIYSRESIGIKPKLIYTKVFIPEDLRNPFISYDPRPLLDNDLNEIDIFYDDLFLVEESTFNEDNISHGNIIKNNSASFFWPSFKNFIVIKQMNIIPIQVNDIFSVLDLQTNKSYYNYTSHRLFRTFWGQFGWGNVNLTGSKPYRVLLFISSIMIFSSLIDFFKNNNKIKNILLFVILSVLFSTYLRGLSSFFSSYQTIPVFRYSFPAILPITVFFVPGLYNLLNVYSIKRKDWKVKLNIVVLVIIMGNISLVAIVSNFFYYFGNYFFYEAR